VGSATSYVTTYIKSTTGSYLIENGKRREVLDSASLTAALTTVPAVSVLPATNFSTMPLGNPIVAENSIFKNSTAGTFGIYAGSTYYPISDTLYNEVKASTSWRFTRSSGTLSGDSVRKLTQGSALSPIGTSSSIGYLLTASGKQAITDIRNVLPNAPVIPLAVISRIDASTTPALSTPIAVRAQDAKAPSYLVANGVKRLSLDPAETTAFLPMLSSPDVQIWPQSAIDAIATAGTVVAPGTIVRVKESGNLYLIDGWAKGLRITTKIANAFAVKSPKVVTRAQLTGYNTASVMDWQKVVCGANTYLEDAGALIQIDSSAVSQWPGVGTVLDAKTCQRLVPNANHVGTLVALGAKKYKLVDKKLKLIRTADEYTALSNGQTPATLVSATLIAELPKGNPTSYVVVAKDTLASLAIKFKTTRTLLRTVNHLTSDKLSVGQILVLP
jgi:LysM repeat protein